MIAIMLAAGEGSRCRPFTCVTPKIFQQIAGIPILEYMLSWFDGTPEIEKLYIVVKDDDMVTLLNRYLQERKSYLANIKGLFCKLYLTVKNTNPDLEIEVIRANAWGTGGDLRTALEKIKSADGLEEDFLVCDADYIINRKLPGGEISPQLDLSDIIRYHKNCMQVMGTVITVAFVAVKREEATRFGVGQFVDFDGYKYVCGFIEKPDIGNIPENPLVNAGICLFKNEFIFSCLDELLPNQPGISLERNLLERIVNAERPRIAAYLLDLYAWYDVGTLDQLVNANIYIASKKSAADI